MKIKNVKLGLRRTVRHERYKVSEPYVELDCEIAEDLDLEAQVEELKQDLFFLIDDLCKEEVKQYEKWRDLDNEKRSRILSNRQGPV